jgi:hypothetical protein
MTGLSVAALGAQNQFPCGGFGRVGVAANGEAQSKGVCPWQATCVAEPCREFRGIVRCLDPADRSHARS